MSRRATAPQQAPAFERPNAAGWFPAGKTANRVLLVPGAEVPLLPLNLPGGLQGRAREQVAWRQLKDQIGLTPEGSEMRPFGGGKGGEWSRALVVDAVQMQGWRQRGGGDCRALLPDYLALPASSDLWVLDASETDLRARLGLVDGFTAETALAQLMLSRLLHENQALPKAVLLLGGDLPWLEELLTEAEIPLIRESKAVAGLGLPVPKILAHGEIAADLRIDARAARVRLRRQIRPWRWPLLAGALAAALWSIGQDLEIRQINQQTAALRREIETVVRDHFVPTGPLLDIRAQVSRVLAARQTEMATAAGRVSPLLLLGQVADVLASSEAVPHLVGYQRDSGLELELRLADFAAVDRLIGALEAAGIAAEVREARVSDTVGEDGAGNENVRLRLGLQVMAAEKG
jgi:general secretion pathway protein L